MPTIRSQDARDWREGRRLRAWELAAAGWTQGAIAEALGVTPGAVSQWMRRAREGGGAAALQAHPPPGATCRLTEAQQGQVQAWLREGAEAHGFRGALWTSARVAQLIERRLGVRYHRHHVSKLLKSWGWSPQKPAQRARQRDEAAIERWRTERWPAIKKDGPGRRAHTAVHR